MVVALFMLMVIKNPQSDNILTKTGLSRLHFSPGNNHNLPLSIKPKYKEKNARLVGCGGKGRKPNVMCKDGLVIRLQTIRDRKILEVHVDKGMVDGQKITFGGEGDQEPGLEPGDIIIVLDEKEHDLYK